MRKVTWGIVAFAMFAVLLVPAAADVYFDPQSSSAERGNTTEVAIWVNATNFASGGINMSYHPGCANVTNWKRNAAQFPLGTWAHYDGYDRIGFVGMDLKDGEYQIGTLTISCVCDSKCATPLDFEEDCKVVNDYGNPVPVDFVDGTFECEVPEACLGDCYDTPADGTNCTGKIIARNVTCNECLSAGTAASWHPTTRCPDRDLYCPDWCFNECPACADGIDNDRDGLIDCPEDDGCACCCDYTETPDEGEPCVPELPTIALTGIGILSLVLWVRSRRGQKRE
jgi:hypothetical protein